MARSLVLICLVLGVLLSAGCGADVSPGDRALLERQKFTVELVSWAPLPDGQLAIDLEVAVHGKSDLQTLTVQVRQVGGGQEELQANLVPLDVAGLGFDGRRPLTITVAAAPGVQAVAAVVENVPAPERRSEYPELEVD